MPSSRFTPEYDPIDAAETTAAAASPVVLAAEHAKDVVQAGEDALKWADGAARDVGNAIDDLLGGGDQHSGESTFPSEPAPPETPEQQDARIAANQAAAQENAAARQREVEAHERIRGAKNQQVQGTGDAPVTLHPDEHHRHVGDATTDVVDGAAHNGIDADRHGSGAGSGTGAALDPEPSNDVAVHDVAPGDDASIIIIGGQPQRSTDASGATTQTLR